MKGVCDVVGSGLDDLARRGADFAEAVADGGSVQAVGGLGGEGYRHYGVVGFLHVGHGGNAAVLCDEGAVPGFGGGVFRRGRTGGAVHAGEMLGADGLDEADALGGVAEGEAIVKTAIYGLPDEGDGYGFEGDDDQGLGVVGGALLNLGQK